jgi:hypothetical protein
MYLLNYTLRMKDSKTLMVYLCSTWDLVGMPFFIFIIKAAVISTRLCVHMISFLIPNKQEFLDSIKTINLHVIRLKKYTRG